MEWLQQFTPGELVAAAKELGIWLAIVVGATIVLKAWADALKAKWGNQ